MRRKVNKYQSAELKSIIGGRAENQDYVAQLQMPIGRLFILCDGAGGYKGGGVASKAATDYVFNNWEKTLSRTNGPKHFLETLIEDTNSLINDLKIRRPEYDRMMTTMVLALIHNGDLHVIHSGDSRLYLIRDNKILFQTKDHSLVQKLYENNEISENEMRFHSKSNVITNALGISNAKFYFTYNFLKLEKSDSILISSDGVHGELDDGQILACFGQLLPMDVVAENIIKKAELHGNQRTNGRHDNASVILYKAAKKTRSFKLGILLPGILILGAGLFYMFTKSKPIPPITTDDQISIEELLVFFNKVYKDLNTKLIEEGDNQDSTITKTLRGLELKCEFKNKECVFLKDTLNRNILLDELEAININKDKTL